MALKSKPLECGLGVEVFDLTAEDKQIAIWYGPAGEWLGLEAEVDGGRTLRYELAEWPTTASTWASIPSELAQEES